MTTLYGIKNCDTVKKAKRWLNENHPDYSFHDFRVEGLSETKLDEWLNKLGWEKLLNKRSTSWKQLSETDRNTMDADLARKTMLANPTIIKRPVLEVQQHCHVGFNAEAYQQLLK